MPLTSQTTAEFYSTLMENLRSIGYDITIHGAPNEMEPAIPFAENTVNKTYDPDQAYALWQAMLKANEGQDNLPAVGMQPVPTVGH